MALTAEQAEQAIIERVRQIECCRRDRGPGMEVEIARLDAEIVELKKLLPGGVRKHAGEGHFTVPLPDIFQHMGWTGHAEGFDEWKAKQS